MQKNILKFILQILIVFSISLFTTITAHAAYINSNTGKVRIYVSGQEIGCINVSGLKSTHTKNASGKYVTSQRAKELNWSFSGSSQYVSLLNGIGVQVFLMPMHGS